MCGIAGKVGFDSGVRVARAEIQAMLQPLIHRGPDGQGIYLDRHAGLGHVRLSIIDLSTGDQPMANEDGTLWIVFNGEIYNFAELRQELEGKGHVFRSNSDTEVILHAYEEFGVDCVGRLRGMFAFALWDGRRNRLFAARDRLGIKPFYYARSKDSLLFASELKGILADPGFRREANPATIRNFLSFNYAPGENTFLRNLQRLQPGHYLLCENGSLTTRPYWDLAFSRERWEIPFETAVEELQALLAGTVKDHMVADVPVGVLLSGGVDSSAILNYAVQGGGRKLKAFTVGFDGGQVVDERPYARQAAERFGAEHFEISITAEDFWDFLPEYVWHMEEPVCEPPAVALHYVSKLARRHVKVVLSGEGGDEAFAGYPNYPNQLRLERVGAAAGPFARSAGLLAGLVGGWLGDARVRRYGHALGRPLGEHYFSRTSGPTALFNQYAEGLLAPGFLRQSEGVSPADFIARLLEPVAGEPLLHQMLYIDTKTWLPDDLLIKADKITMANSIELRVPLLDHRVLEFAASLPPRFKVQGKSTKRVLKAAFSRTLPADVLARKKAGFPVPYQAWLRGELRSRVEGVLLSKRAEARGWFRKEAVAGLLRENARHGRFSAEVFSLLVLELWQRTFLDDSAATLISPVEN